MRADYPPAVDERRHQELPLRGPPAGVRRVRHGLHASSSCCPASCSRGRCRSRWPRSWRTAGTGCSASTRSGTATPTVRPEMSNYSMAIFGRQTIALLDHLEIEQAVLGGTSLGANASLEAAVAAPERVRGLLIEMPVLDNALLACAIGFTPLLAGLTFGAPVARLVGARRPPGAARHVAARRHAARLGQPGPQAVRLGAPGALLRTRGASLRRAREAHPAHARDRAPARPDPPVLGLGHARARGARRPPRGGVVDHGAASHARAPDRRDRDLHPAVLQAPAPQRRAAARVRRRGAARRHGGPRVRAPRPSLHFRFPCPTAGNRRRRFARSARSASASSARRSSASAWSATARAGSAGGRGGGRADRARDGGQRRRRRRRLVARARSSRAAAACRSSRSSS